MKNSNKLLLILILILLPTGVTLSNTESLPSGLYSNVRLIEETGDVVGVEVFFTISMLGNSTDLYALVQDFEGVPLPPTLVKVQMDGKIIKIALPENMGRLLTGRIVKDEFIATFAISEERVVLKKKKCD